MTKIINHLFSDDKKQHQQVRARLLSNSPELIATKPIGEIKVEDIAAHAEVSTATFYKCFRSVEDLLNVSAKQAGQELLIPIYSVGLTISDSALRTAPKTRIAIRMMTGIPLLGRLMLKAEWPFGDARHKGYQDIQKDIAAGITQGCFTEMPLEIGANLVVTTLRVAVQDILNSTRTTEEYETQVIYTLLLSLGVDAEKAEEISKIPFDQLPDLPKKGLVGKILTLVG
jgi:AcrR family transcriptional regulator